MMKDYKLKQRNLRASHTLGFLVFPDLGTRRLCRALRGVEKRRAWTRRIFKSSKIENIFCFRDPNGLFSTPKNNENLASRSFIPAVGVHWLPGDFHDKAVEHR